MMSFKAKPTLPIASRPFSVTRAATPALPVAGVAAKTPSSAPAAAPKPTPAFASLSGALPITPAAPVNVLNVVSRQTSQPPGGVSSPLFEQSVVASSRTPIADISLPASEGYLPGSTAEAFADLSDPSASELGPNSGLTELVLVQTIDRLPGIVGGGATTGTSIGTPPDGDFETLAINGLVDGSRMTEVSDLLGPPGSVIPPPPPPLYAPPAPFLDDATPYGPPPGTSSGSTSASSGLLLLGAAALVLYVVLG